MLTLKESIQASGLIPVQNNILFPNYKVPYLFLENGQPVLQQQGELSEGPAENLLDAGGRLPEVVLRPWEQDKSLNPKATILHFWMPECENCTEGIQTLDELQSSGKIPAEVQVFQVAFNSDLVRPVYDWAKQLNLKSRILVDADSSMAEQLAVLGSPATFLLDESGEVIGRLNGHMNFDSQGFAVLLQTLSQNLKSEKSSNSPLPLAKRLATEEKHSQSPNHSLLNIPLSGWFSVIALVVLLFAIRKMLKGFRRGKMGDS